MNKCQLSELGIGQSLGPAVPLNTGIIERIQLDCHHISCHLSRAAMSTVTSTVRRFTRYDFEGADDAPTTSCMVVGGTVVPSL